MDFKSVPATARRCRHSLSRARRGDATTGSTAMRETRKGLARESARKRARWREADAGRGRAKRTWERRRARTSGREDDGATASGARDRRVRRRVRRRRAREVEDGRGGTARGSRRRRRGAPRALGDEDGGGGSPRARLSSVPRAMNSKWVNPRRRVWLAVLGECFDVTLGAEYYVGERGRLRVVFAGRASRAFATGDFTPEGCGRRRGISEGGTRRRALVGDVHAGEIRIRRRRHGGRFTTPTGERRRALARVKRKIAAHEASNARQRERALMFPDCSSSWSEKEGGFVWCDADSDGAPRFPRSETVRERVDDDDVETTFSSRCACYPDVGVSNARALYPGCEMTSARCRTSLPGEWRGVASRRRLAADLELKPHCEGVDALDLDRARVRCMRTNGPVARVARSSRARPSSSRGENASGNGGSRLRASLSFRARSGAWTRSGARWSVDSMGNKSRLTCATCGAAYKRYTGCSTRFCKQCRAAGSRGTQRDARDGRRRRAHRFKRSNDAVTGGCDYLREAAGGNPPPRVEAAVGRRSGKRRRRHRRSTPGRIRSARRF